MRKSENLKLRGNIFLALMSCAMAFSMSFCMLLINFGYFENFWTTLVKVLVFKSIPMSLIALFWLSKIFRRIKGRKSRVISGATMGLITSFFVTLTKTSFATVSFFILWAKSFLIGFSLAVPFVAFYYFLLNAILNLFFVKGTASKLFSREVSQD